MEVNESNGGHIIVADDLNPDTVRFVYVPNISEIDEAAQLAPTIRERFAVHLERVNATENCIVCDRQANWAASAKLVVDKREQNDPRRVYRYTYTGHWHPTQGRVLCQCSHCGLLIEFDAQAAGVLPIE